MEFIDVDVDSLPDSGQPNMENFGELQYIIDKMSVEERLVIEQFFIHETSRVGIALMIGKPVRQVTRILNSLKKLKKAL